MNFKFCYYGNPVLRKKCEPIKEITNEIRELVPAMIDYFDNHNGIGMAAPQVNIPIRLFVLRRYIHLPDGKWTVTEPHVYINPKIVEYSEETWVQEECCMSIPKVYVPVERPLKIKIESTKLDGSVVVEEIEGLNARCTLHENDHLNGVLCIDRTDKKSLQSVEHRLRDIKKRYN